MSSPETPSGDHLESEGPQPQPTDLFLLAARFHAERPAKRTYFKAQEAIYRHPTNDLSAFRFQLNRVFHVAVLGMTPDQTLEQRLRKLLAAGDPATLSPEVIATLLARRVAATNESSWTEKHYRPGLKLNP